MKQNDIFYEHQHENQLPDNKQEEVKFLEKKIMIGATNKFPQGKLNPSDEGELRFAIGTEKDKIIINFGKELSWIGLDKTTATKFGELLIKKANDL